MDTVVIPKAPVSSKTYQGVVVAVIAKAYALLAVHYHWRTWDASDVELVTNLVALAGAAWATIGLRTATRPIGDPAVPVAVPAVKAGTASGEPPARGGIE